MKKLFLSCLAIALFLSASLAQKPIAHMVSDARNSGIAFLPVTLFGSASADLTTRPDISTAVEEAILLEWDGALAEQISRLSGEALQLELPWEGGGTMSLDLVPARHLSPDFQVIVASTGERFAIPDQGAHFWGIAGGDPNSLACISVFKDQVMGLIVTPQGQFVLGPVEGDARRTHILYRDAALQLPNPFACETDDDIHIIGKGDSPSYRTGPSNCVRMFVECDYTLYQNKGSVANVTTYMTGVMSQVSALYANEAVNLLLHELVVWNVADPYTGPSASNYLSQFRAAKNGVFNGDLAHLVGIHNLGGVAYVDVLCNPSYGVGYSSINASYSNVPTYSWTIEVMTHEIGHNLGSRHTHACVWNGNNTAIDGCGPQAGYSEGCTAPVPASGTIMSYCHLISGVGINFNNGFGPQPGDLIRDRVYNKPCLAECDTTGGGGGGQDTCIYVTIHTNSFESGFGNWTDGGNDCARINNATYANSPTYSIQLRDNTGNSVMTTSSQNWTAYEELTVSFSFITVSFENGEDFWLQLSTNGGSSYSTIADLNAGTQFVNGVRYNANVVIAGPFTSNTRLRFRADASADDDQVYIDDVVVTGCQTQNLTGGMEPDDRLAGDAPTGMGGWLQQWTMAPNPADDACKVLCHSSQYSDIRIRVSDLTGRMVFALDAAVQPGENAFDLPIQALSEGIYVVQLQSGNETVAGKLLISR